MEKIIIADAGSTKIDWLIMNEDGCEIETISTHGLNALMSESEDMERQFEGVASRVALNDRISRIYYYGAGCSTPAICRKVERALSKSFSGAKAEVASDLLGAARALLGDKEGIVCLLGTGSNSCSYDGEKIVRNVPSLGYVLGDEGSGSALGKRLVADVFKGHLPEPIRDKFLEYYQLNLENILDYTYRHPGANRFLASLVPFIKDHIWNPYLYSLVREEFMQFLKRNVAMYEGAHSHKLTFAGSIAYNFSDILEETANQLGYKISKIDKSPIKGLKKYHTRKAL